jgi:hypothetical protein
VKSRCHAALWASAVAAVLAFLASTSPAVAGAITTGATTDPGALTTFTYELTSSVDIPAAQNSTSSTAPQPQVVLDIAPPGAVVALQTGTDSSNNPIFAQPLTPLASSAGVDSDLSNVAVFLKPPPGTSNSGSQELGLSFFGEGLKPERGQDPCRPRADLAGPHDLRGDVVLGALLDHHDRRHDHPNDHNDGP